MDLEYKCYIEADGNVITRKPDGTMIPQFTGNWTILHKVFKYANADAKFKAKAKALDPDLYLGNVTYIMRHPGTNQSFVININFLKRLLDFINNPSTVNFGGLDTCV